MAKATRTLHYKKTTAILREMQIPFDLEFGGKHPRLAFSVAGRRVRFTLPSSPSDQRGHLAAVTNLRRAIRAAEHAAA